MFAKDVFPEAAFIAYCEWWYRHPGSDVAYLAALQGRGASASIEAPMHERARNAPLAIDLSAADAAICPTKFQAGQFPPVFRTALSVQHDGIDTSYFRPRSSPSDATLDGLIAEDTRLVTYATRGMEPHRGFPQFMAAVPEILAAPKTVVVVAGANQVAYGGDNLRGVDWKAKALAEADVDPTRVHFVGHLDRFAYLRLLQRSDAHVYLTVPFILSWSMLEAMSCGCPLVLSDTAPVLEFADRSAALIVDMASSKAISDAVAETLSGQGACKRRRRARDIVKSVASQARLFPLKEKLFLELRG